MEVTVLSGLSRSAGGLFYAVCSLCKALQRTADMQLRVFGASTTWSEQDSSCWAPVPIRTYKAHGPLQGSMALRRWLGEGSVDLVHRHGIWTDPQWAAWQWHKKTGKPYVLSPHGMLDPWAVRNSAWKKKLAGWLFANKSLHQAACIHALCQSELESIRAFGLNNPVAIIPNGVELPEINVPNPNPSNQKKLVFLGRIHPKKGLRELLDAWAKESRTLGKEWKLIVAGWDDGGYEQGLRDQVEDLEIGESVEFVGPVFGEDKSALLRSADAFVLPSFSEGLPISVLEAWSYGLPVMMTDYCNLPDGFKHNAALRVEPDAGSIAEGLAQLKSMSDADLSAMGGKGRGLVERQFTWERIAKEMKEVYEWCLGGGDAPGCVIRK